MSKEQLENRAADGQANQAEPRPSTVGYKGLDPNFRCRGHQYEVGRTYRIDGDLAICKNGFHACENPLDVWRHYPVVTGDGRLTRYALVEQSGALQRDETDSKIASSEMTIKAEIPFSEFVASAVQSLIDAVGCKDNDVQICDGDGARIGSSGNDARIGSSGDGAQIGSSGDDARISSSGDFALIGSSGDGAQIGSNGYRAQIGSSGDDARISSSGDFALIGSSGDGAQIGSNGYRARIAVKGTNSVVASAGKDATVTACEGTWVALAEYDSAGRCIGFASGCIGQNGLKPGVPYIAKDGKLVEHAPR